MKTTAFTLFVLMILLTASCASSKQSDNTIKGRKVITDCAVFQ